MARLKGFLISLLALALAISPGAARAAGSANLAAREDMEERYGDRVRSVCALDGALYLCGSQSLFRWTPGEADVTPLAFELPPVSLMEDRWIERAFSDGERLYLLCPVYESVEVYALERLDVVPLNVDGGAVAAGEPIEVDPGGLAVDYGDGALNLTMIDRACWAGGRLFLSAFDETAGWRVWALDLAKGEGEFIEFDGDVSGMAACGDRLLLLSDDYDARATNYWFYDPETEELAPACEPETWPDDSYGGHYGVAYSEESGRLFYQSNGYVMAAQDFDFAGARQVAELSTYYSGDALLLPGDLYVFADNDAVRVRDTDPDALPELRLTVKDDTNNKSIKNAHDAFATARPDVSVALEQSYADAETLIPAMLSGDDSTDIYVVDVASELYDALCDRGYMLELTDPAITEAVEGMYPAIRDALTREGAVVAVPCYVSGWVTGFNRQAMEALGLTEEDLPQSWPELLAWLPELAATMDEDSGVDLLEVNQSQYDLRNELLGSVLAAWRMRMNARGEVDYGDPALAALMQSVMDLDLGALGVPEEADYDGGASYLGGARKQLFYLDVGCTPGNIYSGSVPALLSVAEGEEGCLPVSLRVAFVNPHSKHPEEAQAFLATLVENLEPEVAYSVSDRLNDPLPDPYVASAIADAQSYLDSLRAQLEAADPADAQAIEDSIASEEARLADLEAQRWSISPEAIAWYRAHAANLAVERYDLLSGSDEQTMRELEDLSEQLLEGRLAPADFLARLNQKARMRAKEGY